MHLAFGVKKRLALFLVNYIFAGTRECFWNAKIKLLNSIGLPDWRRNESGWPFRMLRNSVRWEKLLDRKKSGH